MHTNEFTLMNIHEGEYFRIMVVKILMSSMLGERTDGLQQRKLAIKAESHRPTHVDMQLYRLTRTTLRTPAASRAATCEIDADSSVISTSISAGDPYWKLELTPSLLASAKTICCSECLSISEFTRISFETSVVRPRSAEIPEHPKMHFAARI